MSEVFSTKKRMFWHQRKDGSIEEVEGTPLTPHYHYHKFDGSYWLNHTATGKFITHARTVKGLRELISEPEFSIDGELTDEQRKGMLVAISRWGNRNGWKC